MTWTAPMTAVAGAVFTAAQWNSSVRDNLLETETARALTVSGYSVVSGYQQLAERIGVTATAGSDSTDSTSYDDLDASFGPEVSVITGTRALVLFVGAVRTTGGTRAWISYEISGATSVAPHDGFSLEFDVTSPASWGGGVVHGPTGLLNPGLNTFTLKYRVTSSGTGTFTNRRIAVIPF